MRTNEFFEAVYNGQASELDTYNHIQQITDNFEAQKLQMLCDDFDLYFLIKREYRAGDVSDKELAKALKRFSDEGKDIPDVRDRHGKPMTIAGFFRGEPTEQQLKNRENSGMKEMMDNFRSKKKTIIDIEKLCYPLEFYDLYQLRNLLVHLKRNHILNENSKNLAQDSNSINWLESDKSLEQFIHALKEHNLIEARETETTINNHFKPQRDQNEEPEPIIWLDNQNLLVYLFRNLYKKYLINPAGKEWQTVSKHFIKENGEQYKVRSLTEQAYKQNNGVLPANGTNTIDKIVDRLIAD